MNRNLATEAIEPDWRAQLRDAVRDPAELARLLDLPAASLSPGTPPGPFPLLVPRSFVQRMRKGDPADPLLLQVLPQAAESRSSPGFGPDPLSEHALASDGCIRKYPGRALLITTAACPVHCRYCFRREFPYAAQTATTDRLQSALAALRDQPGIDEIILSGGDPLTLGNARLARLIRSVEALPDVTTLRIHTRFPVVLPARVDAGLTGLLASTRLRVVVVLHTNHPAEIDTGVARAAARLTAATHMLLNQAVLLRGINDSADVLVALSRRLMDIGVAPYYLHMLDRVSGTAHFDVGDDEALALIGAVTKRLPGYLVPRLVRDVPGELSKTPLTTGI